MPTPRNEFEFDVEKVLFALTDARRALAAKRPSQVPDSDQYLTQLAPKFSLHKYGTSSEGALATVRMHLQLDGKPALNLASFVSTDADSYARELAAENLTKNLSDADEYPAMIEMHNRCIAILGNLWHAAKDETVIGTATTGSSEAIQLAGLALKRRWEARQKAAGKPTDKPNIIMGSNAQVALEKFARYFDVEMRMLDVTEKDHFAFSPEALKDAVDENTIGVFAILGSTYTGHYADVERVAQALDEVEKKTGLSIPIHVDGASGALVAPFTTPKFKWDFQIPRVVSVNVSGHKFGLTPVGCGWVVFRDQKYLPDNLKFKLSYLGGEEITYTLNFSRPGHPVIIQYFEFFRRGFEGYRSVHEASLQNARLFSVALERTRLFEVLSDIHRKEGHYFSSKASPEENQGSEHVFDSSAAYNPGLPVVAFRFSRQFRDEHPALPQESVSYMLRHKGYIVPNYPLPTGVEGEVLRVVVNHTLPSDFIHQLVEDLAKVMKRLAQVHASGNIQQIKKALEIFSAPDVDEEEHEQLWTSQGHSRC